MATGKYVQTIMYISLLFLCVFYNKLANGQRQSKQGAFYPYNYNADTGSLTGLANLKFTDLDLYRVRKVLPKLPIKGTPLEHLYNVAVGREDGASDVDDDFAMSISLNLRDAVVENIALDGENYRDLHSAAPDSEVTSQRSDLDENVDPEDIPEVEERNQTQGWAGCLRDYDMVMLPETVAYQQTLVLIANNEQSLNIPVPEVPPRNPVALQMVDANGRRPAGFWQGDLYWIGAVELCFTIGVRYQWNGTGGQPEVRLFKGKSVRVDVPYTQLANQTADTVLKLAIGLCAPDTCTDEDIQRYVGEENEYLLPSIIGTDVTPRRSVTHVYSGQNPDISSDPLAIFTFSAILAVAFVIVISTCYDGWGREIIIRKKIQSQSGRKKNRQFSYKDIKEGRSYLFSSPSLLERLETIIAGFSAYTNFRRMYSPARPSHHVPALDGLKSLAYLWTIWGLTHLVGIYYFEAWTNHNGIWALPRYLDQWSTMVVVALPYANAIMLYVGGFVCVQMFYKAFVRNGEKMSIWLILRYFFYRYWSLMPTLAALLALYTLCYPYLAEGPMMSPEISDAEKCKTNWWVTMLMWHNLIRLENQCMVFTYFIAVIWQLNLVSIVVLVPLVLKPFIGYILVALMYIAHIITFSIMSAKYYDGELNYLFDILQTPWCQAGPYVIGMIFAMILKHTNRKDNWHWFPITLMWLCSVAAVLTVVFAPWDQIKDAGREWSRAGEIAFDVIAPQMMALAAGWITFACHKGYGGVVDKLFRWGLFTTLARILLALTLPMGPVMQLYFVSRHQLYYVHETHIQKTFYAHLIRVFVIGNLVAILLTFPLSRGVLAALRAKTRLELYLYATHPQLLDQFTGDPDVDSPLLHKLAEDERKRTEGPGPSKESVSETHERVDETKSPGDKVPTSRAAQSQDDPESKAVSPPDDSEASAPISKNSAMAALQMLLESE